MNTHTRDKRHAAPGFASLLTVISVGVGLLIVLISMYENTVESQAVQSRNMLNSDYKQREEAFLRALVTIIPNKAMLCMQDDSQPWEVREHLRWSTHALKLQRRRQLQRRQLTRHRRHAKRQRRR